MYKFGKEERGEVKECTLMVDLWTLEFELYRFYLRSQKTHNILT